MIKLYLFTLISFFYSICEANMASPIREGSHSSTIITSGDIDILSEHITMNINGDFQTCLYEIEYTIQSDTSGVQIPLAFVALDYKADFSILFDGQPINSIRCDTCDQVKLRFHNQSENEQNHITLSWGEYDSWSLMDSDLLYFNIPLTKGQHTIHVSYLSTVWTDVSDWTKEYSFLYSLSPAETWKSFGELSITVKSDKKVICNLGAPQSTSKNSQTWYFSSLPGKYLIISYQPTPDALAAFLIRVSPEGLSFLFSITILFIHLWWLRTAHKNDRKTRYFLEVALPSIIFVIIDYIFYLFSYPMIDAAIGPDAGKYHGYYFIMIVFLPIILLVHWVTAHVLNIKWRSKNI